MLDVYKLIYAIYWEVYNMYLYIITLYTAAYLYCIAEALFSHTEIFYAWSINMHDIHGLNSVEYGIISWDHKREVCHAMTVKERECRFTAY